MNDFVSSVLAHADAFRWIFFIGLLWFFYRIVDQAPDLEWMEFISTKGHDGKNHPDWDKVGKGTAVVIGSWAIVAIAPSVKRDFVGFSVLLGVYFTFAGCISGYAAYLRSKSGRTETSEIREPVSDPTLMKVTKMTSEPTKPEDIK